MQCAEMPLSEIVKISPKEKGAMAVAKRQFREASLNGKTQAATLLIHTAEGTPTQRMQYENVPGTTLSIDGKVEGKVEVEVNARPLVEIIREIYGLNDPDAYGPGFVPTPPVSRGPAAAGDTKTDLALPVPKTLDQ
jgi:hypothetical protein